MSSKFVPELYTLSRLIVAGRGYATVDKEPLTTIASDDAAFANLDWNALGFSKPIQNNTWLAITHDSAKVRDLTYPDTLNNPAARKQLFLLAVANDLASVMTDDACQSIPGDYVKVHKLWNPEYAEEMGYAPKPIYDNSTLRKALVLIQESHDATRYLAPTGYRRNLMVKSTSDDVPCNLVPLLTHTVLVSKLYRVLEAHVEWTDNPVRASLDGITVKSVTEALNQWLGKLVMGAVKVPQQPLEPDDLYIFEQLGKCHQEVTENYPNSVLFATDSNFLLFLPGENLLNVHEMLKPYTDAGFPIELEIHERYLANLGVWRDPSVRLASLKELQTAIEQQKNEAEARLEQVSKQILSKNKPIRASEQKVERLDGKISVLTSPPTREVYIARRDKVIAQKEELEEEQRRLQQERLALETKIEQAKDEWANLATEIQTTQDAIKARSSDPAIFFDSLYPQEISDTTTISPPLCEVCQIRPVPNDANVCSVCAGIRQHGLQLPIGKPWLQEGNTALLWIRVQFDEKQLEEWLAAQFTRYINDLPSLSPRQLFQLKTDPRLLSLTVDFATDYINLLKDFELEILKLVGVRDLLPLADDLWIIPQDESSRAYQVLCRYLALLQQHFPMLLSNTTSSKRKRKKKSIPASPLRLGLTITPAAQPFNNSWEDVYNLSRDITLHRVSEYRLELNLTRAQALAGLDFTNPSGLSFLQFLSELSDKPDSEDKIKSALQAQKGKWKPDTALGKILAVYNSRRVTVNELLDFYKICVEGSE